MDLPTVIRLLILGALVASVPLAWWWLKQRQHAPRARMAALTALTLFLTFDLVVFGSFTRLTDSGLGCPDWPGCYGHASPIGASADIKAAEAAAPHGPVTVRKAWIEMIHRYLAMGVGALILVLCSFTWWLRSKARAQLAAVAPPPVNLAWPSFTLFWVLVQGAFGALTVTMKLHPVVVTLHLLGGLLLLAALVVQHARLREPPPLRTASLPVGLRRLAWACLATLVVQVALGGWVSSNYAVVACTDYPQCNGQWWPQADFATGFSLKRDISQGIAGGLLPPAALVAVHLAHRWFAVVAAAALMALAWALWRRPTDEGVAGPAKWLVALLAAQWLTGISNVVLGWPLTAALLHSAGAAALVSVLAWVLAKGKPAAT